MKPASGKIFSKGFVACLCCSNFHRYRQEQRRALQKLEQRASDLETQLSDALVDVQRRDATISELKAALQVCVLDCSLGRIAQLPLCHISKPFN
jgi:hypothetical protein